MARVAPIACAVALTASVSSYAQSVKDLETVSVTASRLAYEEADAPYAAEVHTREMIEQSNAQSLVDYLGRFSSINVQANYGNKYSPSIDIRGYGIESGYENVVVVLDGVRLNNIEQAPQLLGNIPLAMVDHIEIAKGSGSVAQGDGAMGGVISITTRDYNGLAVNSYIGSYGKSGTNLLGGIKGDNFSIRMTTDNQSAGGTGAADPSGHRDGSESSYDNLMLNYSPTQALTLHFGGTGSKIDTRYPSSLTREQYESNPAQNTGVVYTHQVMKVDSWRAGADLKISDSVVFAFNHAEDQKRSAYLGVWPSLADSHYVQDDVSVTYKRRGFELVGGVQRFDGERLGSDSRTKKNSVGSYLQAKYVWNAWLISGGVRKENVDYRYAPFQGAGLSRGNNLSAWDFGGNYKISERYSAYVNLNKAYVSPDIDRFFSGGWGQPVVFNSFIKPANSRNFSVGVNREDVSSMAKIGAFYSWLTDEIYYDQISGNNTNIDKSHKYGLEAQYRRNFAGKWRLSAGYSYVRAMVDEGGAGGNYYNGKELPGVPHHNVNWSVSYMLTSSDEIGVNQKWRSSSYAISDFGNDRKQRQQAYSNFGLSYVHKIEKFQVYASVDNLFDQKNGVWVQDNAIYPMDYRRLITVGLKFEL